jgi:hypothetical protein
MLTCHLHGTQEFIAPAWGDIWAAEQLQNLPYDVKKRIMKSCYGVWCVEVWCMVYGAACDESRALED